MENNEASDDFVSNYAVEEDLIKKAIEHLVDIERREHICNNKQRKVKQQEKHEKPYDKYDWQQLVIDGNLKKLTVLELDQYLNYHKLPKTDRKFCHFKTRTNCKARERVAVVRVLEKRWWEEK